MSRLTIRISDELRTELENHCRREKRGLSEVVRDSLRRYVAATTFQTLRRNTLPLAEARGLLTDEDVFRETS